MLIKWFDDPFDFLSDSLFSTKFEANWFKMRKHSTRQPTMLPFMCTCYK